MKMFARVLLAASIEFFWKFVLIFALHMLCLPLAIPLAAETQKTFIIESVRVVVFPTKEDGRCWDKCNKKTQRQNQAATRRMEVNSHKIKEFGTQSAEDGIDSTNLTAPTAAQINIVFEIAKFALKYAEAALHLPEISVVIEADSSQTIKYRFEERDRAWTVFTKRKKITLPGERKKRWLRLHVADTDIFENDRIGYRKIHVSDRIYNNGGSIIVRFDRVHFMQIELIPGPVKPPPADGAPPPPKK